jgi:hypothetical protein
MFLWLEIPGHYSEAGRLLGAGPIFGNIRYKYCGFQKKCTSEILDNYEWWLRSNEG